ncbi:MAG TPA: hypothetical protein VL916_07430, partial [Ilumatobacteraceae bacterium]|nr:hypothetical protein [Ilumatobacteraceae bacterium]
NIANLVIMRPSASGEVCLHTSQTTHLIVDAAGYMPVETSYTPLVPGRLLDTRGTGQTVDDIWEKSGRKFGNSTISLYVGDRGGLSDDGGAVVLNVTAVGPGTSGFITVYACDVSRPNASNLNYISGVTIPNLVVVSPSADGHVCLYTSGETDLVVDVLGSFEPV